MNEYVFPSPYIGSNNYFYEIFGGMAILAVLPYFLSILLARVAPAGRVIPSLDIHAAAFAILLLTFPFWDTLRFFFYIMAIFVGATYGNSFGVTAVGYPLDPDEVDTRTMRIQQSSKRLNEILEDPDLADNLGLEPGRTETTRNVITFMRSKDARVQFFLRLEAESDSETLVTMFGFAVSRYGMMKSGEATQYLEGNFDHLRGIFDRYKPPIHHDDDVTVSNLKRLKEETIAGKVSGASLTLWKLSKRGWFIITAILLAEIVIPIYFYSIQDTKDSLITVAVVLVSLVPIVQGIRRGRKVAEAESD